MPRQYSLSFLTASRLPPSEAFHLAREAGYDMLGLRMLPAAPGGIAWPMQENPAMLRDALAARQATGLPVLDLEIIRINEGFRLDPYQIFLETGARLGAKVVVVAGDDPDHARLAASFATLCDAALPYGLTCDLEFMPFSPLRDAAAALRVVTAADRPNGCVLVDALHVARSDTPLADVAAIPRERLTFAQICDATAAPEADVAGLIHTARAERLLPGEGGLDLRGLFATLPRDLPVSIEVPSDSRIPVLGHRRWARMALAAARQVPEA
jgi:sugar phosphate isomerase/epimerase